MPTDKEIILFQRAVEAGKELTLRRRIARGMPPDAVTEEGSPAALHLAALKGLPGCAEVLLRGGADPNRPSTLGTPLALSGRGGSVACVKLLLQCGARVDQGGMEAAVRALRQGHVDVVAALLDAGLAPQDFHEDQSLLDHVMGQPAAWSLVPRLLAAGADPRGLGVRDRPLVRAAKEGDLAVMNLLVAAGADVDEGAPLAAAASAAQVEACARLLELGAKPGEALHAAASSGALAVVELLLSHGVSAAAVDELGRNALTVARIANAAEVADRLRAAGAVEQPAFDADVERGQAQHEASATSQRQFQDQHPDARPGRAVDGPFSGFAGLGVLEPSGQVLFAINIFGRFTQLRIQAAQFRFDD